MTIEAPARTAGTAAGKRARLAMTPGRTAALFAGVPVLAAIILATAVSAAGQLDKVSRSIHVAIPVSGGQVTADVSGDITVRQEGRGETGGAGGTAVLTATAHSSFTQPKLRVRGPEVSYSCPLPVGNCGLDGTLAVPAATGVSLVTSGGDVTVQRFTQSPLTVHTGGGDMSAGTVSGALDADTGGGDMNAGSVSGPLHVTSGGGDVTIARASSARASIASLGGDVTLTFTRAPQSVQISSSGGDVTLVLPRGVAYRFSVSASGGDISNSANSDAGAARTVTISSLGGDVNIIQAG